MPDQIITGATSFNVLTFLAARTISLASSGNFVTAGSFNALGSAGSLIVLRATTASTRAVLTVKGGNNATFVNATDIDSFQGTRVLNPDGTNTNTINWGPAPVQAAGGFFEEMFS